MCFLRFGFILWFILLGGFLPFCFRSVKKAKTPPLDFVFGGGVFFFFPGVKKFHSKETRSRGELLELTTQGEPNAQFPPLF